MSIAIEHFFCVYKILATATKQDRGSENLRQLLYAHVYNQDAVHIKDLHNFQDAPKCLDEAMYMYVHGKSALLFLKNISQKYT